MSRRVLLGLVLRSAEGPQFASGGSYQGIASSDATKPWQRFTRLQPLFAGANSRLKPEGFFRKHRHG